MEPYESAKEAYADIFGDEHQDAQKEEATPAEEPEEKDTAETEEEEETDEEEGSEDQDAEEPEEEEPEEKPKKKGNTEVPIRKEREARRAAEAQAQSLQAQLSAMQDLLVNAFGQENPAVKQLMERNQQAQQAADEADMKAAISVLPSLVTNDFQADAVMALKERKGYTYERAARGYKKNMGIADTSEIERKAKRDARQEVARKQATTPPKAAVVPDRRSADFKKRLNSDDTRVRNRAIAEDLGLI